jgi:hypothetical protein
MSVATVLFPLAQLVVRVADETPEDEDVKAGWTAFALFLLLIAAVALLGFSLAKQLRKAQAAKDAGVYGDDEPEGQTGAGPSEPAEPENHSAP